MTTITKGAALRIALAGKTLAEVDTRALTLRLAEKLGLPVTEEKLAGITVADLKALLTGEESVEPDIEMASIKLAVRYLWGENGDDADVPKPESYTEGEIPDSLRVAVASNTAANLDGHFGSAPRFLVYQVGKTAIKLVDVRPTLIADEAEDKNVARSELINDCQLVYVQSIGGPAAAKVVRAGVHPVKIPVAGPATDTLVKLQAVLDAPPPWLAKIMGVEAKSLSRFQQEEEELEG
ncbi:MAG TPA: dinitrogenase iron-molybdenum cofactor biosynthesis protein [Thiobacillaceae bacterium]|nr:dinitrogenase iron-molybdenum cofactor biosynthesis protein [Thiobacillaceae bacterium]HNA81758.1 dinitrogenase iron-molybdenum cofactor biosynthesis protein [Thiobacillaceae bacterium]HNF89598.1 dinitrogenase iron-molybdenum cofactor biosynthesis protein [Thiobacillaceae bacterium]HNH90632.1 dinitrogenase iron-molybdenum cofactor biosynthesis protein [Thiobacillaceae bacterium]